MLRIKNTLSNKSLITDFLGILIITFAIVLILNGIILMTTTPAQSSSEGVTPKFATEVTNAIPGIPFAIADLSQQSLCVIGIVSWIVGLNLMFVGLGIWAKHKFARMVGLIVFGFASCFQIAQFLLLGAVGSPISVMGMSFNIIIAYLLFSKYDCKIEK